MNNTIYLTLGQASKETGISKTKLSKELNNGTLSYKEKTKAGYKIDPAELFRVHPKGNVEQLRNTKREQSGTLESTIKNSVLEAQNELLRIQLEREKETVTDLRNRLDSENEERRKLTMMLTDQREQEAAPVQNSGLLGGLRNLLWGSGSK